MIKAPRQVFTVERMTTKRLLTMKAAATYLSVSYWTIRELALSGAFPIIRSGRKILIDVEDLDRWIERQKCNESY